MAKQIIADEVWAKQIPLANKYFEQWENTFHCKVLQDYYEGFQWAGSHEEPFAKYKINKVFETIQIKNDQFVPSFLEYKIAPKAGNADFDLETAALSAALKQDVLNNLVGDENNDFCDELRLSYRDSFFYFGVFEVGYAADWIENPKAFKPLLKSDTTTDQDGSKPSYIRVKGEPLELPANEQVYFKRIDPKNFRVGGMDRHRLKNCTWYGYFEYVYKKDLLAMPGLMNKKKVEEASGAYYEDTSYSSEKDDGSISEECIKVWHIWHNKARVRLLILDEPFITLSQRTFTRQTIFDYRPDIRLTKESFYPIPQVFHWIASQDEINETREQLRNHRRKFIRKFQVVENAIDDPEIEKFETGPDGSLITVKRENAISAIQDAPLGNNLGEALITSTDDLNQISGISSAVRGKADRTTATEADIINQRANIRENAENDRVARWLCKIGRETLLCVRDNFTLGLWVEMTSDPNEQLFMTYQNNPQGYAFVTSEDLSDGYDFRIRIDPTTLSKVNQHEEKVAFFEFLNITSTYPQIALSPKLIRETAYRCGYRNESVIKEMQQMALLQQMALQMGMNEFASPGSAQQKTQESTPKTNEGARQITNA